MVKRSYCLVLALALLCLAACTSPQPHEQTTSPEVVQTQETSPEVENTQAPENTQTPETTDEETTPSDGTEGADIPDESVEFGD